MDLHRIFTEHPASVGETYGAHMAQAAGFGTRMMLAGMACMVHAVLPFLFVKTGSQAISQLNDRMVLNRRTRPTIDGTAQPAKVTPFAGGNGAAVRKSAAGDFFQ
jgi:hypothetical protein